MSAVFADSFYYLAILNWKDAAHARAIEFTRDHRFRITTTAWVITEIADALSGSFSRKGFLLLLSKLENDPSITIVPPSKSLYDKGLRLYARRHDKDWSLTDCISFTVMEERGLTEALTADHHFQQAGFKALLA
jgi:uncharacterized protein